MPRVLLPRISTLPYLLLPVQQSWGLGIVRAEALGRACSRSHRTKREEIMIEYLLTLSLLGSVRFSDLLERMREVLSDPLVLLVLIGLGVLLLRPRVR